MSPLLWFTVIALCLVGGMLLTINRTPEEQLRATHSLRPFYTPNQCSVALNIVAVVCDRCDEVHGWALSIQILWWGPEYEFKRS